MSAGGRNMGTASIEALMKAPGADGTVRGEDAENVEEEKRA